MSVAFCHMIHSSWKVENSASFGMNHVLYLLVHIYKGKAGTRPMPKKHEGCSGAPPHTLLSTFNPSLNQEQIKWLRALWAVKNQLWEEEGREGLPEPRDRQLGVSYEGGLTCYEYFVMMTYYANNIKLFMFLFTCPWFFLYRDVRWWCTFVTYVVHILTKIFFLTLVTPNSYCLIGEWIWFEYMTIICYW